MNTKPLLIVLAVIVVLGIGYFVFAGGKASAPTQTATTTDTGAPVVGAPVGVTTTVTSTTTTVTTPAPKHVTITYGANGFSPANVTIPVGSTVTWVNQSGGNMWVASGIHPTHTVYDGTSVSQHCAGGTPTSSSVFDECSAGSSFSFTFTKAGSWPYHNHAQASAHGTITVQ